MIPHDAIPTRFAGLPVEPVGAGIVDCHISFYLRPEDVALSADEFVQRLLSPAEAVLADEIDRRGRHRFVGIAVTETADSSGPVMMISALRTA